MMEDHEFCDSCPGCRPVIINPRTGEIMPNDDPVMVIVNRVWDKETTYAERRGFIEVTLKNSRNDHDMKQCMSCNEKIQVALENEIA